MFSRPTRQHAQASSVPPASTSPDEYERLLRLDENAVSKGINRTFQKRILREVTYEGGRNERAGRAGRTSHGEGVDMCAVCRDDFQVGEKVISLNCTHMFHRDCLEPWLEKERTCPCCRKEVYHKAVP